MSTELRPYDEVDLKANLPPEAAQRSEQQEWTPDETLRNGDTGILCGNKILGWAYSKHSAEQICGAHNAALAAERQRREQAESKYSVLLKKSAELSVQLLSAQAAIDFALAKEDACDTWLLPVDVEEKLRTVDLSLLHQHDAEARKPLVDALKKITEWSIATPDERYKLEMKWFVIPVYDAPNRIAAAALAKVKEGK